MSRSPTSYIYTHVVSRRGDRALPILRPISNTGVNLATAQPRPLFFFSPARVALRSPQSTLPTLPSFSFSLSKSLFRLSFVRFSLSIDNSCNFAVSTWVINACAQISQVRDYHGFARVCCFFPSHLTPLVPPYFTVRSLAGSLPRREDLATLEACWLGRWSFNSPWSIERTVRLLPAATVSSR
jgi:hypothetical protein